MQLMMQSETNFEWQNKNKRSFSYQSERERHRDKILIKLHECQWEWNCDCLLLINDMKMTNVSWHQGTLNWLCPGGVGIFFGICEFFKCPYHFFRLNVHNWNVSGPFIFLMHWEDTWHFFDALIDWLNWLMSMKSKQKKKNKKMKKQKKFRDARTLRYSTLVFWRFIILLCVFLFYTYLQCYFVLNKPNQIHPIQSNQTYVCFYVYV